MLRDKLKKNVARVTGPLHVNFFLQLATQRLLRCTEFQEKLLRVTWPIGPCRRRACVSKSTQSSSRFHVNREF